MRGLLVALMVIVVAGCAGGGGQQPQAPAPSGQAQTVAFTLSEFKFDPNTATAKAGSITFSLTNKGQIVHNFKVDGQNVALENIGPGETKTVTATLAAGTYTVKCDIPGHAEAGMTATLTVTP